MGNKVNLFVFANVLKYSHFDEHGNQAKWVEDVNDTLLDLHTSIHEITNDSFLKESSFYYFCLV